MPGGRTNAVTVEPSGKVGRPSSLSEATLKSVKLAILGLATLDDAFMYAGIDRSTGLRWLAKGRKATKGEYRRFYDEIEQARNSIKVRLSMKVANAALRSDKVALDVLARRWPKEWARTQKVEVDDKTPGAGRREQIRDKVLSKLDQIEDRLQRGVVTVAVVAESEQAGEREQDREQPEAG